MVKELHNVVLGVKFTKASVRANIISEENNETLADSLGKIQKWYEDFKPVVWSGDADTVNGHVVNVDVPADAKFTDTLYTFSEGTTNGTFNVSVNDGLATPVTIHGLGSAAFTDSTDYATSSHNHAIGDITNLQTELDSKINTSLMGQPNGVASLNDSGLIPASQLPSYVDDAVEGYLGDDETSFYKDAEKTDPYPNESGKIYVDISTNKTYRWSGTQYTEISKSLALGETSDTAYAGDKGKQLRDDLDTHLSTPHAPANAQENVIEIIKRNGVALTVTDKTVDISVPTKLSDLTLDTSAVMKGATASANGAIGLVPLPTAGSQNSFLKGDATWSTDPIVETDTLILHCVAAT